MKPTAIGLGLVLVSLCFSLANAATWVVDQGGGGDATTINGGMALASSGDTVLVNAGTYFENVVMADGVSMVGLLGWGATIIEPGVDTIPLVACSGLADPVLIKGFTVRGGRADLGAGIYCEDCLAHIVDNRLVDNVSGDDAGAIAYIACGPGGITGNRFESNSAYDRGGGLLCETSSPSVEGNTFYGCGGRYGGGVCCAGYASPDILDNTFESNTSGKWGGAVSCMTGCSPKINGNTFDYNSATSGGAVCCWNHCNAEIVLNSFTGNQAYYGGALTTSSDCSTSVGRNTFTGCQAEYGAAVTVYRNSHMNVAGNEFVDGISTKWGGALCFMDTASGLVEGNLFQSNDAAGTGGGVCCWNDCEADIQDNVFWDNSADYGGGVSISEGCEGTCRGNTFYASLGRQTGSCIDAYNGGHVVAHNNILAASLGGPAINCWGGGTAAPDCNDFWDNASDLGGCAAGPNDFFLDPMLCDPATGNFYIDCQSPCNERPGCGLVGALGVGCGSTRTDPSTWGKIKAIWR